MSDYTLSEATEFYDIAKKSYLSALQSASISTNNNSKFNQKINDLKKQMDFWNSIIKSLNSSSKSAVAGIRFV